MLYVIQATNKKFEFRGLRRPYLDSLYYCHTDGVTIFTNIKAATEMFLHCVDLWPEGKWALIPAPHEVKDIAAAILDRCPRLVAHLIAESLGYATPVNAAHIISDGHRHRKNYCEWIDACYNQNPRPALERAFRNRHRHHGYMAEYRQARAIVAQAQRGNHPMLASWF